MLTGFQIHVPPWEDQASAWRLKDAGMRVNTVRLQSESAHENLSAIEWLSTSIVHDLRNPLGTIYAAAEMLMHHPGPTQVKRLSTNIYRAAARMRKLLANLTSLAYENRLTVEMCDIREDENHVLITHFGHGFPFFLYAGFCAVEIHFVWRYLPETTNRSLEEISSWSSMREV